MIGLTLNLLCSVIAVQMDGQIPAQMSFFMPFQELEDYRNNVVEDFNEKTATNIMDLIKRTDVAALREEVIAMKPGRESSGANVCEGHQFERIQRFLFEFYESVDHDYFRAGFTLEATVPTNYPNVHSVKHHLDCINHAIAFVNIFNANGHLQEILLDNDDHWFAFIIMVGLHSSGRVAEWGFDMDPFYYARTKRITQFVLNLMFNQVNKNFGGDVLQFIAAQRSYMIFSFNTEKEQSLLTLANKQHGPEAKYDYRFNKDTPKQVHGSKQSEIITEKQVEIIKQETINFANFMETENKLKFQTLKLFFYNIHMWDLMRVGSNPAKIVAENKKYHIDDFKPVLDFETTMKQVAETYSKMETNRCEVFTPLMRSMMEYENKQRNEKMQLCDEVLEQLEKIKEKERALKRKIFQNCERHCKIGDKAWPAQLAGAIHGYSGLLSGKYAAKKAELRAFVERYLQKSDAFKNRHGEVPEDMDADMFKTAIQQVRHDLQGRKEF